MDRQPRIRGNDYAVLKPPDFGEWTPHLSVSVIIPAWNCQEMLDLTLAALATQTYPSELIEVVVVDDGSTQPLRLPQVRPERTRLMPNAPGERGIAAASNTAFGAAEGDVVLRLDSDMLVHPHHVEAHLRWHHLADYLVVLGYKRFVEFEPGTLAPNDVIQAAEEGRTQELFDFETSSPHEWVETIIDRYNGLRDAGFMSFKVLVGATVSLPRSLYQETGGMDPSLFRGEDSEFAYRLAQAGAVFVPEPEAQSWHLGASTMMTNGVEVRRFTLPFLLDRMAQPHHRRKHAPGNRWTVAHVEVVLDATAGGYEQVAATCDRYLAGGIADLTITLCGPWHELVKAGRSVLDDPHLDLRLLRARFRGDNRVRFVAAADADAAPVPYRLTADPAWAPDPRALRDLVEMADKQELGLITVSASDQEAVRLMRTAAVNRARKLCGPGEVLDDLIEAVSGARRMSVDEARFYAVTSEGGLVPPEGHGTVPLTEAALYREKYSAANRARAALFADKKKLIGEKRDLMADRKRLAAENRTLRKEIARLDRVAAELRQPRFVRLAKSALIRLWRRR